LDWYRLVFELIDTRSFSNMWYWIGLAVVWSSAAHWVLGAPHDMIRRAARRGGQDERDLEAIVRISVGRALYISREAGLWLLAFLCGALTALGLLAFVYWVEFAQAVFLVALPLSVVGMMRLATAHRIDAEGATGERLRRLLLRHRFWTQVVGMFSIFVTALFGMFQNLSVGALGG
jgi:hypothetical protein